MEVAIHDALQGLTIKDLRGQCRARGLNPGGSLDALRQRLTQSMQETNNAKLFTVLEQNDDQGGDQGSSKNNYQRPGGNQNLGNRISDRPSSRVLAPPGGSSQIVLGDAAGDYHAPTQQSHNPSAVRAAEQVLSRMGLGDTDQLVSNSNSGGAQQFYQMPTPMPSAYPVHPHARGQQGASQLSFGDYRLPSTVAKEGPEAVYGKTPAQKSHDQTMLDVDSVVKPLLLKDLRTQCRIRNLSPGGGLDQLRQRLGEHMIATGDLTIYAEGESASAYGAGPQPAPPAAAYGMAAAMGGGGRGDNNNYARPSGMQNVGNFITDRPSSRVLAPPGGNSQINFGQSSAAMPTPPPVKPAPYANNYQAEPVKPGGYGAATSDTKTGVLSNNYSRPGGQQNVGNFLTDRPSSRVLAPPGGKSQITFG